MRFKTEENLKEIILSGLSNQIKEQLEEGDLQIIFQDQFNYFVVSDNEERTIFTVTIKQRKIPD